MSSILEMLSQQIGGAQLQEISRSIGADPAQTRQAIGAALPVLLGGLAKNAAASPDAARSLASALDNDHDGSVLDNLGDVLGMLGGGGASGGGLGAMLGGLAGQMMGGGSPAPVNPRAVDGEGILRHVFGERRAVVEQAVSRAGGLDASMVGRLLPLLAPLVMGALGKVKREQNLDPEGLVSMLGQERATIESQTPALGGLLGLLDADDDGDVKDDLLKLGGSMLGSFFGGKG
ncbi:DUF937 domain-containing protein [Rhodocaloribacter sp.]